MSVIPVSAVCRIISSVLGGRSPGVTTVPAPAPTPAPSPTPAPTPVAQITSAAGQTQPGATQRYYRATADRPGAWTISAGATIDASTGVWTLDANNTGDGTTQIIRTPTITFTPTEATGAVSQITAVTLTPITAPASTSESYTSNFAGANGTLLASLPGWSLSRTGTDPIDAPVLDGAGNVKAIATSAFTGTEGTWAVVYTPQGDGKSSRATFTFGPSLGPFSIARLWMGATDWANGFSVGFEVNQDIISPSFVFQRQGGVTTDLPAIFTNGAVEVRPDGTCDVILDTSADGNSILITMRGKTDKSATLDMTGKTHGKLLGLSGKQPFASTFGDNIRLKSFTYSKPNTTLLFGDANVYSPDNIAQYPLTWVGVKPLALQHMLTVEATGAPATGWLTGDAVITGASIQYTATAPGPGSYRLRVRILNDTGVVAVADTATAFFTPRTPEFASNWVGPNYFYATSFENDWGKIVEIRDAGQIMLPQAGITGFANLATPVGTTLTSGDATVVVVSSNPATGLHRVQITGDMAAIGPGTPTRAINWAGTKPAYMTVTQDGRAQDGFDPVAISGLIGTRARNLDTGPANYVPIVGHRTPPPENAKLYAINSTGCDVPIERQLRFYAAKMAADPNFVGPYDVIPLDITDAEATARFTAHRDIIAIPFTGRGVSIFELGNEWPWNIQFTGSIRGIVDGWRNGHYATGTFAAPNTPLDITVGTDYVEGTGSNTETVAPAMASGAYLACSWGNFGVTVWRAKQAVPAGTHIAENAYFTRVANTEDSQDAGHRWKAVRGKQLMDICQTVYGSRFDTQVEYAVMGQAVGSGDIMAQLQREKNYVPGHWAQVKRIGFSYYFGHAGEYDCSTATVASLKAALYDNMPITKARLRNAAAAALAEGKILTLYEGLTHPNFDRYNDTPVYRAAWDTFFSSADGQAFITEIMRFIKTLGALATVFTLAGGGVFSLKDTWADVSKKRYLGYVAGIS